ncbi:F-box/LRR-repeat protein At4g14103-like isoform X5 [Camellia sinensis]|uniref:F-box/LRR-repeat protein At4g14103-like isoform X5 n=1 Tax=Camellia sinensis TaxID=4442 RepID=UPI00103672D1|nr:F-box/LRR-repeat protein At4g14103-like isoform X5 [Camellia sinensis]
MDEYEIKWVGSGGYVYKGFSTSNPLRSMVRRSPMYRRRSCFVGDFSIPARFSHRERRRGFDQCEALIPEFDEDDELEIIAALSSQVVGLFKLKIWKRATETMTSMAKHLQPSKKVNIGDGEDRISSLPDSLIIYVLSFIPTKYAFRTTVLSKRWKDLWAFVPNLDFDASMLDVPKQTPDVKSFMNFIDWVLFFHGLPCIRRFHLKCSWGFDVSRLPTWISVLTARGVEELDVELITNQEVLILPQKLFSCRTLVVLKLISELNVDFPASFYLPNLKVLHVSLSYPQNGVLQKLFSNCPLLEDLHFSAEVEDELEMIFDVSWPALKKLQLHLTTSQEFAYVNWEIKFPKDMIVIDAPVLEHLTVHDDYLSCYSLKNLSSLVTAYIDVGHCCIDLLAPEDRANNLFMLLEGITSVKSLSLDSAAMGALEFADDNKLLLYPNLTYLELTVHNCYTWRRLSDLLDSVPKLETLILTMDFPHADDDDVPHNFDWIEPSERPICLSCIKEITVSGFKGDDDELKLLKYFFENAEVLNNVRIDSCNFTPADQEKFFKNLVNFRRASKVCEIEFFGKSKEMSPIF